MRAPAWLALLLAAACGGTAERVRSAPPQTALRAWVAASRGDDPRAAYELLASPVRNGLSYEEFARRWHATRDERREQADGMEVELRDGPPVGEHARVTFADGKTTDLVREEGGWRLTVPPLSPLSAATPREALSFLAAALEARSFDTALRIMSASRREGLHRTLAEFLTGLKAHLDGEIVVTGDRAFLNWADGKTRWKVTLVREHGEWRIDDVARQ